MTTNNATITYTIEIAGIGKAHNPKAIHSWMARKGIRDLLAYARDAAPTREHTSQPRGGTEQLSRVGWTRHACLGTISQGDPWYANACCLEVWTAHDGGKFLVEVWETGDFSGHSHWSTVLCEL